MSNDCLFCKSISGEIPSNKVYSDDHVYAFHDINPAAPTHVLVIPRKHLSAVNDRSEEHEPLLGALMSAANRIVAHLGLKNQASAMSSTPEAMVAKPFSTFIFTFLEAAP